MREVQAVARLPLAFYARDTAEVARALLGQRLVRVVDGARVAGLICETEAYSGPDDEASHAYRRTPRSAIMYGPPGRAYVYFIYGMHHCLNIVTESDERPGAVLLRALLPVEGLDEMRARRGNASGARLAGGPGNLCKALGVTLAQNGLDLTTDETLFLESGQPVDDAAVRVTPRIGVRGGLEARTRPWRFLWRP